MGLMSSCMISNMTVHDAVIDLVFRGMGVG